MKRLFALLALSMLFVMGGCSGTKASAMTPEQARSLLQTMPSPKAEIMDENAPLREITPEGVFKATGAQIFKDSGCESYLIRDGKATVLGIGFGGYGVVQVETCDFDEDGNLELLYTYSFGSGLHRALLAVYDLDEDKNYETTLVTFCDMALEKVSDTEFAIFQGKDGLGDLIDPQFQRGLRIGRIVADSTKEGRFAIVLDEPVLDMVWMK